MDSPEIVKGKSKLQDHQEERVGHRECRLLHIDIQNTEGIDRDSIENPSPDPFNYDARVYTVLGELGPGVGFSTRREQGLPDPNWLSLRVIHTLQLYDDMDCRYLYVEVVKLESSQNPGSSRGYRVVGRVAIPLPKRTEQVTFGRYGLVRQDKNGEIIAEGHINVAMKVSIVLLNHHAAAGNVDNPADDADAADEPDDADAADELDYADAADDPDGESIDHVGDSDDEFFGHVE